MSRGRALGGALLALACAASCSLVTSLEGYTGGAGGDASVAAEALAPPAPPPEPDGGRSDADAGGRFCDVQSPAPKVCEDFDGVVIGGGWVSASDPLCSVGVVDSGARTPPGALLSTTDGTAKQHALLRYPLPSGVTRVHLAYDLRAETFGEYAEIGYIRVATTAGTQQHYLRVGPQPFTVTLASEVYFGDGGVLAHDLAAPGKPAFDVWTRVRVDLDLVAHEVALSIDGGAAAKQPLEAASFLTGTTTVEVGIGYSSLSGKPWALRTDDVTVDWE